MATTGKSLSTSRQIELNFEPGLTERYGSLLACCRGSAHISDRPMKVIAADMDLSESDLSRKLSGHDGDPRRLSVDELVRLMEVTGDLSPIHWLLERFAMSADQKRDRAQVEFIRMLPQMLAMAKAMGCKA